MQDEVNNKTVALAIRSGKMTAEVLEKALKKFLLELHKDKQPKIYHGKQSIRRLVRQNTAINNIEVTDGNIKSFERTARKYGIDFALKKDISTSPPRYLVFFKGRDVDVLTQAFKEFTAKTVKDNDKPSLRKALSRIVEQAKSQNRDRERAKSKDRGVEL